ncbi:MAG: D-alanine--D-alanine ligase [bacterium]
MAKVLVLCGGETFERRVSLRGGDAVARGLAKAGHDVRKMDTANPSRVVDATVEFFDGRPGMATDEEVRESHLDARGWRLLIDTLIAESPDLVVPILHGGWGEDGRIQSLLELHGFPYLGSGPLASALAMNKWMTRGVALHNGIRIPYGKLVRRGEDPEAVFARLPGEDLFLPVVVKPNTAGSTVGLAITDKLDIFCKTVHQAHSWNDDALIEEYIPGRELTVTVLDGEALPVLEIRPKTGLYDYTRKYTQGETEYICPAPIPEESELPAREMSEMIFAELGCRHIARVDWKLRDDGALYFLEVNTLPGMTDLSLVPMAAAASGLDFSALMNRFVEIALRDAAHATSVSTLA